MTDPDPLPEGAIRIKRDWNVSDDARNSYGIVDTNPDPADPAIALAIRIRATGERIGRVLACRR